jgi:cystathionine beta-synthase
MLKTDIISGSEILKFIGNTPLIKLNKIAEGIPASIYAKLEMYNPSGSIKDRLARSLIEDAAAKGKLSPGGTVIEVTSGNTGNGAELILTPHTVQADDPRSNYSVARRLSQEIPDSIFLNQYDNPANIDCHYNTTGPEIWEQLDGDIEAAIVGAGTGGTISGIGRFLKERNPSIKIIGIDSEGSILTHYFSTGEIKKAEHYEVEGIGSDRPVGALDFSVVDDMIIVADREAFLTARRIAKTEGIFCGGSSGAVYAGALRAIKKYNLRGNVAIIFADSGNRYLSKLYSDNWMKSKGYI